MCMFCCNSKHLFISFFVLNFFDSNFTICHRHCVCACHLHTKQASYSVFAASQQKRQLKPFYHLMNAQLIHQVWGICLSPKKPPGSRGLAGKDSNCNKQTSTATTTLHMTTQAMGKVRLLLWPVTPC